MLKRALLYIRRNIVRTLILFTVMFSLGIFISASVIIRISSENVRNQFLRKAGASLTVSYRLEDDITNITSWMSEHRDHRETFTEYFGAIEELLEDEYVTDYSYSLYMIGYSDCLYNARTVMQTDYHEIEDHAVLLFGVDRKNFVDLETSDINIVSGRSFERDELQEGRKVCIVNENMRIYDRDGNYRNAEAGDVLDLSVIVFDSDGITNAYNTDAVNELEKKTYQYTVIGTFHVNEEMTAFVYQPLMLNRNKIYVPDNAVLEMHADYEKMRSGYEIRENRNFGMIRTDTLGVTNIVVYTADTSRLWIFSQRVNDKLRYLNHSIYNQTAGGDKSLNMPKNLYFQIVRSTDAFTNVSWVLKTLDAFAGVILYVSIGAFIIIMSLIIYLFMKNRKTEIGILMSLGEKRGSIILQTVMELLLIGLLAFSLSAYCGNVLAKPVSDRIIKNTLITEADSHDTDERGNIINKMAGIDVNDVARMYEIVFSKDELIRIFIIETGIVIVSSAASVIYTLKTKPKEVLLG